jgi:hyperosmotically inducible protein
MKHGNIGWKQLAGPFALALLVGCGNNNNGVSSAKTEDNEAPKFGSATDIASNNSPNLQTNANNGADIGIGGPVQAASGNYKSQPLSGQDSDSEIAKRVKVALTTGSLGTTGTIPANTLTKIDVQVKDGVVTLSGPVSSEAEKQTVEKQVAGYQGVKGVKNNLTVGGRDVENKPDEPLVPRTPGNQ